MRLTRDEPVATVMGDPDQLGQLLANLMRNAVIHTPAGTTIEVTVACGRRAGRARARGARPRCRAVPDDAGDQLFERFWRTEGGRSRGKGGAGLGLAIVKAIAVAHGGSVRADNVRRTTAGAPVFRVSLPRSRRRSPLSKISAFSRRTLIWITQIEPVTVRRAALAAA